MILFWMLLIHTLHALADGQQPASINNWQDGSEHQVLIMGTAKNAAAYLPKTLQQIDELGSHFKSYQTLFFTDQNDDETTHLLAEYVKQSPQSRQLIVDKSNHGIRTERIAYARNQLMQTAYRQGDLQRNALVIQLDMDDVLTGPAINQATINQAIKQLNDYDVICANSRGLYYDRWALRTNRAPGNCIKENTCDLDLSHWFGADFSHMHVIDANEKPIPVESCFGGLALYKSSTLVDCLKNPACVYRGRTNDWRAHEDCEHVSFHRALTQFSQAKLAIAPMFHVGPTHLVSSAHRNNLIPYFISDKTLPLYADYVFDTHRKHSHEFLQGVHNVYAHMRPTHWQGIKTIYVHTQDLPLFYSTWLAKITSSFVLITAGGDENIPSDIGSIKTKGFFNQIRLRPFNVDALLNNTHLVGWFTQNFDHSVQHPKIHPIPIGISYKALENKNIFGVEAKSAILQDFELQDVVSTLQPTYLRKKRVFSDTHLNDTSKRHSQHGIDSRTTAYQHLKDNPLIDFQSSPLARNLQWQERGEYMFSLSLIGNGFDCHRTWESLALGNIVLLQSSPIDHLFKDLPVVIIHDWSEINEENLVQWAEQYQYAFSDPNFRLKLSSAYWINQLLIPDPESADSH